MSDWKPASDRRGYVRGDDYPQTRPAPVSRAEAENADRLYDLVLQLSDEHINAAAAALKRYPYGERLFHYRYPRNQKTERIWAEAVAPEDDPARLRIAEELHLFRQFTGYYDARRALWKIPPDCCREHWRNIGMALKDAFGEDGWPLWREWSARGQKYPGESELRYQWDSFRGDHPKPATLGTLMHLAGVYSG